MALVNLISIVPFVLLLPCFAATAAAAAAEDLGANLTVVVLTPNEPQVVHLLANSTVALKIKSPNVEGRRVPTAGQSVYVFETHTQDDELHLSDGIDPGKKTIRGNHNGITIFPWQGSSNVTAFVSYPPPTFRAQKGAVTLLALVRSYPASGVIPGVCLKGNNTNINSRPNVEIKYTDDMVEIAYNTAGFVNQTTHATRGCGLSDAEVGLTYSIYQMYMEENNLNEDYFLTTLASTMLLKGDILENGKLVESSFVQKPDPANRRKVFFASYPRTAVVFAVVVTDTNNHTTAVYVSSSTYGCTMATWTDRFHDCYTRLDLIGMFIAVVTMGVGTFLTFLSHRMFKISLFIFAFYAGSLVGYVFCMNTPARFHFDHGAISLMIGVILGAFWVSIWKCLGSPALSVFLHIVMTGYLVAFCIVFLPSVGFVGGFQSDAIYWITLSGIALAIALVGITKAKTAAIVCGAAIGSYSFIYGCDSFAGGHLKYIIINQLRRANLWAFNQAVLTPPFQATDIALTVSWVILFLLGAVVQLFRESERPPFPAESLRIRRWERAERIRESRENDESRPLLINDGDTNGSQNVGTFRRFLSRLGRDQQYQDVSSNSSAAPPAAEEGPLGSQRNYDSFYHAALLLAEAARNAEVMRGQPGQGQAQAEGSDSDGPSRMRTDPDGLLSDSSREGFHRTTTSDSLVVPCSAVRSPGSRQQRPPDGAAAQQPLFLVGEEQPYAATAPHPQYQSGMRSPPTEEEIRQTRSNDIFKPPSPPEN